MKTKLTLEQHTEIAKWLNAPGIVESLCLLQNCEGKSSPLGKAAKKMYHLQSLMKGEMEGKCYRDGFADVATDLYYPKHR